MHHGAAESCTHCGATLTETWRCARCGAEQHALEPPPGAEPDPIIGRTIGNRYRILELLGVGGMGRVYRAHHVGLDRLVAVKFINPRHLANQASVARFMVEARAASRLSHPHVIAIHDFGGGSPSDEEELYLVMELLTGPSLGDVLRDGPMPIPRIVEILCQVLGALDEAHHQGVTHRDIKPENIVLEPTRAGGDHVKVIDFGIAKLHAGTNVTGSGEIVGTPRYMAPEQARGQPVGPAADIYAVGVLLFQMLTGQRAFDGKNASELAAKIVASPRPNPRVVAPERDVPAALAAVCMRAMDLEPARRFPGADAFARALLDAVDQPWSPRHSLLFSPRALGPEPALTPARRPVISSREAPGAARAALTSTPTPAPTPSPHSERYKPTIRMKRVLGKGGGAPEASPAVAPEARGGGSVPPGGALLGRTADLAWAREQASFVPGSACFALTGRSGIGRTRLLDEIARVAAQLGARVIKAPPGPPPPLGEVSGDGLRALIPAILGDDMAAQILARRSFGGAEESPEVAGLRRLFVSERNEPAPEASSPGAARVAHGAALRWALTRAVAAAAGGRVLLVIDDVDRLDGVSQAALADALSGVPILGLAVAVSSERPSGRWAPEQVETRALEGLTREDAALRLGSARWQASALRLPEADIEPLYLELLARWWGDALPGDVVPARAAELVEWRLRRLSPLQLRIVQAVAVLGRRPIDTLVEVLDHDGDLGDPLAALERAYLVVEDGGFLWLRHGIFGRAALALAPRRAVAALHARAAVTLATTRRRAELRAYHALRGHPDTDAFLLVEEAVRLRLGLGDQAGAVHLLGEAFQIARGLVLAGELEAASAWAPLGRRLGALLLDAGRADEAYGVLREILQHTDLATLERALVAEQLALIATRRGRHEEAQALLGEALGIAEGLGEESVATRIRQLADSKSSGVRSTPRGAHLARPRGNTGNGGGNG